jgi:hypothetical protein
MGHVWKGVGCAVLVAVLASGVNAQALYGSLVGNVTDETGAALPGASVSITQRETNLVREIVTNETGGYNVPNLLPGTYQIDVKLPGFSTYTARDIAVRQGLDVRVDAKLSVGALEESIIVSGQAAVLQTESAAVQSLTTSEQLETVPTSGRSYQTAIALMPGVGQPNYDQSGGSNNPTRSMAVTVNGQPPTNTVFRLDGVSQINQFFQQIQAYTPSIEAIETVSVVTSSFDADQGMAGGAAVNVQVKSGSNSLAGSIFEHVTDYRMKSKNYFLPAGDPKGTGSTHIYGGTVGGPITRNKIFFFASAERTRQRTDAGNALSNSGANGLRSLPTMAMREGNFAGTGTVLYDPRTGSANGTGRTPFAFQNCPGLAALSGAQFETCNYIPADRINPIAKNFLRELPAPTLAGFTNNYFATNSYDTDYNKYDGKITWTPSARVIVNGRLGYGDSYEDSAPEMPAVNGGISPIFQGRIWDSTVHSHSLAVTSTLSPSMVMDGVFGFTRTDMLARPHTDDCWGELLGVRNSCQPPLSRATAIPQMTASVYRLAGGGEPRAYRDPQWSGAMNFGWTKGDHNVKFGGEMKILHQNHYETQTPTFTFNGGRTALGPTGPNAFNAFADFLLGDVFQRTSESMTPMIGDEPTVENIMDYRPATLRTNQYGVYLRDQFELNSKMTVSAGVRWEYYPLSQRADRGLEIFDFESRRLLICGVSGNHETCGVTVEKNLFTPRLGWAYRPTESTVIRVGYSRNPQNDTSGRNQMPPFQAFPATIIVTEQAPNNFASVGTLNDGVTVVPRFDLTVGSVRPAGGMTTYRGKFERGTISSWNVSLQQLLPMNHSLTMGYVANRQRGMTRNLNENYGRLGGGTASQPFADLTTAAINVQGPYGRVDYDSFQTSVNKRMSHGLQYTVAYTFAKAIDWWAGAIPQPEYWHLNKGDQANSNPHLLNTSVIYSLPFGSGRKFLNDSGLASHIAGGWQVNAFFTARSGTPFTVTASNASLNAGNGTNQTADQIKEDVEVFGFEPGGAYFDVTAFRPVTEVRFGTAGYNTLRGPGVANLDLSVFRTFALRQSMSLQIRIEALNATNTPHFANPAANVANLQLNPDGSVRSLNGFGVITSTNRLGRQYDEREFRLGARLTF